MRLSRKALVTLALLASGGIGGSIFYALQPAHRQESEELYHTDGHATADSLASAPKDYGQVPRLGPPLPGDLGRPIVAAQRNGIAVPTPPIGGPAADIGRQAATSPAEMARRRTAQERDAARMSKLFLGNGAAPGASLATASVAQPDPAVTCLPDAGNSDGKGAAPGSGETAGNDQASKRAFMSAAMKRAGTSDNRLEAPPSPYVIQAGSVIAAALITGIRSDLPGQITAQVTQNVFDSPTGRILLIPQGSKLIGEYDSLVSFGQNRVLLAWDRLIFPDGRSLMLDRLPGADPSGRAGLQDRTNYHWGGIAKAALLSTALGIGAEAGSSGNDDLSRAIREGTSDTINQAGQQIVRRQLNVPPTLTIRPGFARRVVVTRDLVLAPIAKGAE
jgi:type IV secretion system protein VirB10